MSLTEVWEHEAIAASLPHVSPDRVGPQSPAAVCDPTLDDALLPGLTSDVIPSHASVYDDAEIEDPFETFADSGTLEPRERLVISEDLFREDTSGLRLRATKGEVFIHRED